MGKRTMGKQIALLMSNATLEWLSVWVWPLLIVIGLGLVGYVAFRLVRDGTRKTPSAGNAVSVRFTG